MSLSIKPVLLVPCALASLVLAACGGSGSKASASSSQGNEQQILKFTRCMREHGVNISTPNGPFGRREFLRAAREDQVQSFARCMRSHGVEVQAQTQGGAVRIGVHMNNAKENPAFQAAQKACESYLPKPPGGRAGGPKPGSGAGPSTESSGQAAGSAGGSSLGLNAGK